MAKDIIMPLLSPSMTEGTLVKWLKKEGDAVKSGDILAEVETDKATMDLEAFDSGILRKILIQEGTRVPVQSRIGIIGTTVELVDDSRIDRVGGLSRWYILMMPPLFWATAMPLDPTRHAATAAAINMERM